MENVTNLLDTAKKSKPKAAKKSKPKASKPKRKRQNAAQKRAKAKTELDLAQAEENAAIAEENAESELGKAADKKLAKQNAAISTAKAQAKAEADAEKTAIVDHRIDEAAKTAEAEAEAEKRKPTSKGYLRLFCQHMAKADGCAHVVAAGNNMLLAIWMIQQRGGMKLENRHRDIENPYVELVELDKAAKKCRKQAIDDATLMSPRDKRGTQKFASMSIKLAWLDYLTNGALTTAVKGKVVSYRDAVKFAKCVKCNGIEANLRTDLFDYDDLISTLADARDGRIDAKDMQAAADKLVPPKAKTSGWVQSYGDSEGSEADVIEAATVDMIEAGLLPADVISAQAAMLRFTGEVGVTAEQIKALLGLLKAIEVAAVARIN